MIKLIPSSSSVIIIKARYTMSSRRTVQSDISTQQMANAILYEWWYSIAEKIFENVCIVTELDEEQIEALRATALRPNDFQLEIED